MMNPQCANAVSLGLVVAKIAKLNPRQPGSNSFLRPPILQPG